MNHRRGLTLVEVLVVVTILSVLALSVYTVFKSGIDVWSRSEGRLEIYQSGRAVLDQISRELAGAFATDGITTKAKLAGTAGASEADSDTIEFITVFADSVYKIRYSLIDSSIAGKKTLERSYINYTESPAEDYESIAYTPIEFVPATIDAAVSNIKFKYLPVMAPPTGMADWTGAVTEASWPPSAAEEYDLPEAVKIILTLKDANNKDYVLQTEVYIPNSEAE